MTDDEINVEDIAEKIENGEDVTVNVDGEEQKVSRSQIKKVKKAIKTTIKTKADEVKSMSDAKWLGRWEKICGGEIDWNNKYVKCERTLNSFKVQAILTDQHCPVAKRREKVRKFFPDDESYQCYLTEAQPLDPDRTPYTYIETKSMLGHARKEIKIIKKKK